VSREYYVMCQVSMVIYVNSLSEYQFYPYTCYFDSISVYFFNKISI